MKLFKSITLLSIAILAFSSFTFKADEKVKWYDFNEGVTKAKSEKKIALIDAYTAWCGWCKRMDRDTYTNANIISKIEKNFVPIKFNPEIEGVTYELQGKTYNGYQLLSLLANHQQTGYPTTFFILTKKNRIMIEPGYQDPTKFETTLEKVVTESKN
jgi:thioredoxin-related protein